MRKIIFFLLILFSLFFVPVTFAQSNFVSVVNPIRGNDFWNTKNQKIETAVLGQIEILKKFNIRAGWLIRYDALSEGVINRLASADEKGLFLEVTPSWARDSGVDYHEGETWHSAGSAFLTGYEQAEREKLIDTALDKFKKVFGVYPKSVGAWWIDSYSLNYMQTKYGIIAALIVADQYTTDNYQIWGQYFSTPYYPSKNNALHPAQSLENKLPIVITQWATRDPLNAYGNGVFESTFSVQANDYIDFHDLDTEYFSKLLGIYTNQPFNKFSHLVIGLENSYSWQKYSKEYENQISAIAKMRNSDQLAVMILKDFSSWYKNTFPNLSPEQIIVASDPLGTYKKVVWFMNPYYRAGWFFNAEGSVFRDIRQYIDGEEELCFKARCDSVNFATSATRVLDEVSFGHKWVIDEGRISDFKVSKTGEKFVINYLNEAGKLRIIEFLPRDISVDGKISSIDTAILDAIKIDRTGQKNQSEFKAESFKFSLLSVLSKTGAFILLLVSAFLIPGFVLTNNLSKKNEPFLQRVFLSLVTGFVLLTIIFYILSLINLRFFVFIYILINFLLFLRLKILSTLKFSYPKIDKLTASSILVILGGTVFQNIPTFKSGLVYSFGMGFWGPNTHDGVWHISLINQLLNGLPVKNPVFADTILKNYHFFYDLLIAATAFFTKIPILDLVFRFYPIMFSLLLGIGTYYLIFHLFSNEIDIWKTKVAVIFSLYFIYFAGSFGWIVEYIKQKSFGGESAFWANQAISFNLNPPFAISLLIIIALLYILFNNKNLKSLNGVLITLMLGGSLVGFKAYGAILVLISLLFIATIKIFKKDFSYFLIFIFSSIITLLIFFSNFQPNEQLIVFSPFWFIHSMIDSPDRVGWTRLTLARVAGLEQGNWFKFISAETVSLFIFIMGNLGMRILSLFSLTKIKSIVKNINLLFILIFSLSSILIPILFIQSGNPWNTIQFTYYGLYISALIAGVVLASFAHHLPKMIFVGICFVVLVLAPINSITTATYYLGFLPHGRVEKDELAALEYLSKQDDGIILTYPYDKNLRSKIAEPRPLFAYDSTAYVSALSKKGVYIEDEPQNQILLTDYKKRLVAAKYFFSYPMLGGNKFLKDENIKFIYLPKIYKVGLDETTLNIKNIYENDEVLIYEVNK